MANDLVPINEVTTTLAVRAVDLNVKQVFGQIQEYIKELKGEWMYAQMQMGDTAKQVNARVIDVKNTFKEQAEEQMQGMSGIKDGMQDWIDSLDNLGDGLDSGTSKSRRMTMALLSVMFFGMMLQRTFMGLLQPAADVFGIFDLWSTTLMVIFIPVMELLMPLFISLVQWLMEMPEGLKLAMGLFTLLGVVVGTILMTIGQFGLGLTGLTEFFPKMVEGVKVLESFATKWGNKAIGIFFTIKGFADLTKDWDKLMELLKDKKAGIKAYIDVAGDLFKDLGTSLIGLGFLSPNKLIQKQVGTIAAVLVGISIATDFLDGEATNLREKLDKALTFAFAAYLATKSVPGAILALTIAFVLQLAKSEEFKQEVKNVITDSLAFWKDPLKWIKSGGTPTVGPPRKEADFIWRPGQSPISISPNDNLMGFKGNNPMGGSVIINQTINASINDMKEFERMMAENNRELVSKISSQHGVGA